MITKRYEVTLEDIEDGKRGDCTRCPVSLAIQRQGLPSEWLLNVGGLPGTISFCYRDYVACLLDECRISFLLPISVSRFIANFDAERTVEPFEFDLPDLGRIL